MKIQNKIILIMVVTLLFGSGTTLFIFYNLQKWQTIEKAKATNIQLLQSVNTQLNNLIDDWSSITTSLHRHQAFKDYLKATAEGTLATQPDIKQKLEEVFVTVALSHPTILSYIRFLNKDGMEEVLVKNQTIQSDYKDRSKRDYYQNTIESDPFQLTQPTFRKGSNYLAMDWGMALAYNDEVIGVLTITLNTEVLDRIFAPLIATGGVDDYYITNMDGLYLYNSRDRNKEWTDKASEHEEAYSAMIRGENGAVLDSSDGEVMSYASNNKLGIRFLLATNEATIMESAMTLFNRTMLLFVIVALLLGIVVIFATKRMIINPIQAFTRIMGMVSSNSINNLKTGTEIVHEVEKIASNTDDEFGELSRSFLSMSHRLEKAQGKLDRELQNLSSLVSFTKLVGNEVSEEECYEIFVGYLKKHLNLDRIVIATFNNSENFAEIIASYGDDNDKLPFCAASSYQMRSIQDPHVCRVVRSGHKFVVNDVQSEYRCQYQEIIQENGSYMCIAVATGGAILGWIHLVSMEKEYFTEERRFAIESYVSMVAPAISSIRLLKAHKKMAIRDKLTQLYNRRFLDEATQKHMALAARYKQPISFLMLDVDHFKRFNDLYGHAQGDKALQILATILLQNVRESDIVARYGGEEFTIILPNTGKENAEILAEKIRKAVETCSVMVINETTENITISLGLSTYPADGVDVAELISQADNALYRSKAGGRNRVTLATLNKSKDTDADAAETM